jgi:hypothetical protein
MGIDAIRGLVRRFEEHRAAYTSWFNHEYVSLEQFIQQWKLPGMPYSTNPVDHSAIFKLQNSHGMMSPDCP